MGGDSAQAAQGGLPPWTCSLRPVSGGLAKETEPPGALPDSQKLPLGSGEGIKQERPGKESMVGGWELQGVLGKQEAEAPGEAPVFVCTCLRRPSPAVRKDGRLWGWLDTTVHQAVCPPLCLPSGPGRRIGVPILPMRVVRLRDLTVQGHRAGGWGSILSVPPPPTWSQKLHHSQSPTCPSW